MPECNNNVGSGNVTYSCNLNQGHDGPCSAREIATSVRIRKEWEQAQSRLTQPMPVAKVPSLYELGMQGPPQTSAEGLMEKDSRGNSIPREHPDVVRRRQLEEESGGYVPSLEEELVRTAGGVDISRIGVVDDPRLDFYRERERKTRGAEYREYDTHNNPNEAAETFDDNFDLGPTTAEIFNALDVLEVILIDFNENYRPLTYEEVAAFDLVIEFFRD